MNLDKYQNKDVVKKLLNESRTIAVYGASEKQWRTSHRITSFLLSVGYEVIPVNPNYQTIMGMRAYPSLLDIEKPVDIVDVFRRPSEVLPVAEESVRIKAGAIWFQEGVINDEAARIASAGGLDVVMDLCILKEYNRYMTK